MISHPVLNSVLTAASTLTTAGYKLDATIGTPLESLCVRSVNMATDTAPVVTGIVEASAVPLDAEVGSAHDHVMNDVTENVVRIMRGGVDLIRNEVLPLVKELHEKFGVTLDGLVGNVAAPVGVLPNVYHKVWGLPMLRDMVAKYDNIPLNPVKWPHEMPSLSGADIRPMLNTGVSQIDAVIDVWLDDMPADEVLNVYNAIFVNKDVAIGKRTNAHHFLDGTSYTRNANLLAFLIAQGMERNLPDGLNVPVETLRTSLAKLQAQAGRAVFGEIDRRRQDSSLGVLVFKLETQVISRDFVKRIAHVNNDVYVKYLEEGGDVETLYGAILSGREYTVAALTKNAAEYKAAWTKSHGMHQQRISAMKFAYQKEAAMLTITRYVNSLADEKVPAPRDILHTLTTNCLNGFKPADFNDTLLAMRKLVCCVLYADTNADMFLCAMDQAELDNPDFSPRECALFAAIDLYARWAASQITAVKC